ncbi:hypothetical protein JCM19237_5741 [Photobacterium aphoticum]|uniref:Uncharacterized protein n=1 Tax=Photobacterium aphoticum TaxID=754436 RepID=A0A090QKR2_9GAMM|nr:hypothetical protein JCM19237_5741 [Photobacterium aphoticum]
MKMVCISKPSSMADFVQMKRNAAMSSIDAAVGALLPALVIDE